MKRPRLATPQEEQFIAAMRVLGWVSIRSHRIAVALAFVIGLNVGGWLR